MIRTLTLGLLLLVACGPADDPEDEPAPFVDTFVPKGDTSVPVGPVDAVLALTGDPDEGEALYVAECASCHLVDGTGDTNGGTGKDLTVWMPEHDDATTIDAILSGRTGMPAYRDVWTDQQVADVTAWLRLTFDP